jgi:hypothetical protein
VRESSDGVWGSGFRGLGKGFRGLVPGLGFRGLDFRWFEFRV